jgi:hypothetical protein
MDSSATVDSCGPVPEGCTPAGSERTDQYIRDRECTIPGRECVANPKIAGYSTVTISSPICRLRAWCSAPRDAIVPRPRCRDFDGGATFLRPARRGVSRTATDRRSQAVRSSRHGKARPRTSSPLDGNGPRTHRDPRKEPRRAGRTLERSAVPVNVAVATVHQQGPAGRVVDLSGGFAYSKGNRLHESAKDACAPWGEPRGTAP